MPKIQKNVRKWQFLTLKLYFFSSGYIKHAKTALKTKLRVSEPQRKYKSMEKMNQKPVNTYNKAKKGIEISNRGLWLFKTSLCTLSKYPLKITFRFNFSIIILIIISKIPLI